jgi:hypothetical protein
MLLHAGYLKYLVSTLGQTADVLVNKTLYVFDLFMSSSKDENVASWMFCVKLLRKRDEAASTGSSKSSGA